MRGLDFSFLERLQGGLSTSTRMKKFMSLLTIAVVAFAVTILLKTASNAPSLTSEIGHATSEVHSLATANSINRRTARAAQAEQVGGPVAQNLSASEVDASAELAAKAADDAARAAERLSSETPFID